MDIIQVNRTKIEHYSKNREKSYFKTQNDVYINALTLHGFSTRGLSTQGRETFHAHNLWKKKKKLNYTLNGQ